MINLQEYKNRKHIGEVAHTELTRAAQVERYLPLVRSVVSGLRFSLPPMLDTEDLLGYGTLGLLAALDRFDPTQGVKFETYAATRIRGYIIDQLRALDWVPRSARQRARQVERAREALETELGRAPTANEVAGAVGLDRAKYDLAVQDGSCVTLSLDAMLHPDDENTPGGLLSVVTDESSPNPGAALEAHDLRDTVTSALSQLTEREQRLLRLYYYEERTLQEISRVLEVSESRACQIHTRALKRLRTVIAA